ncbi:MAG: substrate-binding domain-containing protein [Myxococcota bacterium]
MPRTARVRAPLGRAPAVLLGLAAALAAAVAGADDLVVGASWQHFQEERWRADEAALRTALARLGAGYLSADAQSSAEKQVSDIESLVARGADALLVVAHDAEALRPVLSQALAEGIPVIAYDHLIEMRGVFYVSFDNREVGRIQARELLARRPSGRYVFIKGAATDPNAHFVHAGQLDVLGAAIAAGRIRVVGDQFIDGWLPEVAQRVSEQILTANDNAVDAVVCSNDGMAGGVVAALSAQGLEGVPVSGQDGDRAALNRIARGLQTVSVWKDSRRLGETAARVAVALAQGRRGDEIDGSVRWSAGPRGVVLDAILLSPVAITRQRLDVVIDAGWVDRESVCRDVAEDPPPACR